MKNIVQINDEIHLSLVRSGSKKQIITATSQFAMKNTSQQVRPTADQLSEASNFNIQKLIYSQTFAQPETQYVYRTNSTQSSAQMSQTSDYNSPALIVSSHGIAPSTVY